MILHTVKSRADDSEPWTSTRTFVDGPRALNYIREQREKGSVREYLIDRQKV